MGVNCPLNYHSHPVTQLAVGHEIKKYIYVKVTRFMQYTVFRHYAVYKNAHKLFWAMRRHTRRQNAKTWLIWAQAPKRGPIDRPPITRNAFQCKHMLSVWPKLQWRAQETKEDASIGGVRVSV